MENSREQKGVEAIVFSSSKDFGVACDLMHRCWQSDIEFYVTVFGALFRPIPKDLVGDLSVVTSVRVHVRSYSEMTWESGAVTLA